MAEHTLALRRLPMSDFFYVVEESLLGNDK